MSNFSNNRLSSLDNLRTFLALLGFPFHAALFLAGFLYPHHTVSDESLVQFTYSMPGLEKSYFLIIYYVHVFRMPAFFLLAGFFARLLCGQWGEKKFIGNRLYKIGLPFLFCQLWLFPVYVIFFSIDYFSQFESGLMTNFYARRGGWWGEVNNLNFDWFLYFLLWCYVVTFFVLRLKACSCLFSSFLGKVDKFLLILFSSRWRCVSIGLFCSLILCQEINLGFMPYRINLTPSIGFLGSYIVWYCLGWWLQSHQDRVAIFFNDSGLKFLLSILLYGAFLYWYYLHVNNDTFYNRNVGVFLFQLSTSFSVLALFGAAWHFAKKPNRIFRYISGASYWLYLTQIPIIIILIPFVLLIHVDNMSHASFIFLSLEVSGISFLIALLSYQVLVRCTWLSSIFGGKTRP